MGNKAMLWGAIAGTIPDLDVLLNFVTDELTATQMHRGFSHSLVFCVIGSFLLGWLAHKIHKNREPTRSNWNWMFFWCLVTHPLLDAHTTWGTQFFWPFEIRLAYKNIFVVDPLYTIPFLILVVITMFYKRTSPKRRKWNRLALIVSTSYLLLTFVFKGIGYIKFREQLQKQSINYVTMDTQPTPLNSVLWNAQVETKTGFRAGYYSLFDKSDIKFLKEIPKNHHLLDPYVGQKQVQQLLSISNGWYYVEDEGDHLMYTDIRFGQFGFKEDSPYLWKFKLTKNPDGTVNVKQFDFAPGDSAFSETFSELLERIKGV